MSNQRITMQIKLIAVRTFLISYILACLVGCEAFTKKFVRKSKKESKHEEPILVPEEYSPSDIPIEQRYRQYFLYWKSWQDELINALGSGASHKKISSCIDEAIKNFKELRPFLFEEKQKDLDVYLDKLKELQTKINQDIYNRGSFGHRATAESLKRNILRNFSYSVVENHLR